MMMQMRNGLITVSLMVTTNTMKKSFRNGRNNDTFVCMIDIEVQKYRNSKDNSKIFLF